MKRQFFGRLFGSMLVLTAVSSCSNENTGFKHIAPPTVDVVDVSNITLEGNTGTRLLAVPIVLSHSTSVDVVVSYKLIDGTATVADNDYDIPADPKVTIYHGESYAIINVTINGDYKLEDNETLTVELLDYTIDGVDYPIDTIAGNKSAVAIISNDDQFLLNDTGITTCATDAETSLLCNNADNKDKLAPYPGQDAVYGLDAIATDNETNGRAGFNFTMLDTEGNSTTTSPACILDNRTQLTWEVKTDIGLQAAGNNYTWYNTDSLSNGGDQGIDAPTDITTCSDLGSCGTATYITAINTLNTVGLCKFSDWRLPTVSELHSLVDNGAIDPPPYIDTNYFAKTQSTAYWTSDSWSTTPTNAWSFDFNTSNLTNINAKSTALSVRLVRGDMTTTKTAPTTLNCNANMLLTIAAESYVINKDSNGDPLGTVTDLRTKLMWKQCAEGISFDKLVPDCAGLATSDSWTQVLTNIATLNSADGAGFTNYKDWRLPNKKELESLVERSCSNPAINTSAFPNDIANMNLFWTSSPNGADSVWVIDFTTGDMTTSDMTTPKFVRLVRDL